jgi:putative flippase GtrA
MPELDIAVGPNREAGLPTRGRLGRVRSHREARHLVKYGVVGVANVLIDFIGYAALVSLGIWYPLAKTLSLVAATANGYTLNRMWTFRAGRHQHIMLGKYVAVQGGCLALNIALLVVLVELVGLDKVIAQALVLPFIAIASFAGQRLWTFGDALR